MVNSKAEIPEGRESEFITKSQDYLLRSKAINQYPKLVTDFFTKRIEIFIEDVLKPFFGVNEYLIRYVELMFPTFVFITNACLLPVMNSRDAKQFMPTLCSQCTMGLQSHLEHWLLKKCK